MIEGERYRCFRHPGRRGLSLRSGHDRDKPADGKKPRRFKVTQDTLQGLLGIGGDHVYRSGVTLQMFQENGPIHKDYNQHLKLMMRSAFAAPITT